LPATTNKSEFCPDVRQIGLIAGLIVATPMLRVHDTVKTLEEGD